MDVALTLYQLQQAELERADCLRRLAQVNKQLADSSKVAAARAKAKDAEAATGKAEKLAGDRDQNVQSLRTKLEATEARMFGGTVTNPKELFGLQAESESLKRRISKAEDELLEAMIAAESATEKAEQAARSLADVTAQHAAENQDLIAEKERLEGRLAELEAIIRDTRSEVSQENLDIYAELARRKGGRAVAPLSRADVCGGCGVGVPLAFAQQARERTTLTFCPSCERILCPQR